MNDFPCEEDLAEIAILIRPWDAEEITDSAAARTPERGSDFPDSVRRDVLWHLQKGGLRSRQSGATQAPERDAPDTVRAK